MSMDVINDLDAGQEWSLADQSTGGVGHSCSNVDPQPVDRQVLVLNSDRKIDDKPVDTPPNPLADNSGAETPMDLSVAAADTALDLTTGAQPDTTTDSQSVDKPVDNMCYICQEMMASDTDDKEDESERTDAEAEVVATVRELRCGHRFHEVCVDTWLNEHRHNTCPYCKLKVTDQLVDESNRSGVVEYGHYHHHDYDYGHFIPDEVTQYIALMEAYGTETMVFEDDVDELTAIEWMYAMFW